MVLKIKDTGKKTLILMTDSTQINWIKIKDMIKEMHYDDVRKYVHSYMM